MLKQVYCADAVALVPGGGTFGMEAVARQFGRDARVLVVRNGWFSYRWSQIFDTGGFMAETHVIKARKSVMVRRRRLRRRRLARWWRGFWPISPMWCLRRMWKPRLG